MTGARIFVCVASAAERAWLAGELWDVALIETFETNAALLEAAHHRTPDLIISGSAVAGLSGHALCDAVRRSETLNSVPVMLLTTEAEEAQPPEPHAFEPDDFLLAPVNPRRLVARAASLLKLRSATQQLEARTRDLERSHEARKRVEVQLRLSQKLESVGRIAGGIAHEINTPVQFISDSTFFLNEAFSVMNAALERRDAAYAPHAPPEVLEALRAQDETDDLPWVRVEAPQSTSRVIKGAERIAAIVQAMKQFAHPDCSERSLCDLNHAIQSTLTIATNEYKYVATLSTQLGELPPVMCNLGQINEVVLGLVCNSANAISAVVRDTGSKGIIEVRSWRDGDWACVSVRDTGTGIPEEIRPKVFDPFFTTKEVGKGIGQGLAIAHAVIVEEHKGSLSFDTELGVGTTFTVRIPIHGHARAAA